MFKNKKSFTLIELAIYMVAVGVLVILIIGGQVIVENAKVVKLNDELEYYEKANAHFIIRYNSLPGLLSERKCLYYEDFSDYCRNQDDINLTTSEHIYTNDNCDNQLGCILESNGTSGSEDVLRNFLLPMRYLKTAGEIDTMEFGIEKELTENEDYSKKTWALSKYDRNVYVNIYNYYNRDSDTTLPFLFNNHNILGHTINSGRSYDHYEKLLNRQKQYLVYHKFTTEQKGAISTNIAFKLDKKFDDGKPLTGRITTYATSDFSSFANSEYAQCIDGDPINYESTKNINYIQSNGSKSGYCNILYQLKDLSDNVNDGMVDIQKSVNVLTPKGDPYYKGRQKCQEYNDGSISCINQIDSCNRVQGQSTICCNYEDSTEHCDDTTTTEVIEDKIFTRYFNDMGVSNDGSYLIDEDGNEYSLIDGEQRRFYAYGNEFNFTYRDNNGSVKNVGVMCDWGTGYIKVNGIVTNIRKLSINGKYLCCCDYYKKGSFFTNVNTSNCPGPKTC